MSREVRRVPKDWKHPKKENGEYTPLYDGYKESLSDFITTLVEKGLQYALDYHGRPPDKNDYMPDWPEKERTHYQMYEDISEGTPISPVMNTPENLARWLSANDADYHGRKTNISYEAWLNICKGGWAPSFVMSNGKITDGITAMNEKPE